jgi:5-methylthioribose kinase
MYSPTIMKLKDIYYRSCPNGFLLKKEDVLNMERYLTEIGFLEPDEFVRNVEIAGEGNMNLVQRVASNKRNFIVKQSRPWVEKYPYISAPGERSIIEGQFYALVKIDKQLSSYFPNLLFTDENSSVLIIEDLGEASDYLDIYYKNVNLEPGEFYKLIEILSLLHSSYNVKSTNERIYNRSMRALNAEHIFDFPFKKNNKFNLDEVVQEGLQKYADQIKENVVLLDKIQRLKSVYLADGDYLLMGDFYPASWLNTSDGIRVIDPEFCFFGPVEFDLGVLKAHLLLGNQAEFSNLVTEQYQGREDIDPVLLNAFTGIEILRRIVGLAQLPLPKDLSYKENLINLAVEMFDDFE